MSQNSILLLIIILILLIVAAGVAIWFLLRRTSSKEDQEEEPPPPSPSPHKKEKVAKSGKKQRKKTHPLSKITKIEATPKEPITLPPPPTDAEPTGEKIRILIVDDNTGTRENVSRLLYFENDLDVVGQAINGRQGVEMSVELKPHIVLMDINMPDMDGIEATRHMMVDAPYSQIVIMSVQADRHYMREAMAAGARDFQPKPFTSEELVSCIRRVYNIGLPVYRQFEAAERAGELSTQSPEGGDGEQSDSLAIAIYSPKGGTGVSTIAINLAIELQQKYGEVVLMDGDLQFGDVAVNLNIQPTRTMADLVHNGELDAELLPEVVISHSSGLKLLLCPPSPEGADVLLSEMMEEIVQGLKKLFNFVIIDTSSQLTDETMTIIDNADRILVITVPELPSIKDTKLFLQLANTVEIPANQLEVIINQATIAAGIAPSKIEEVLSLKNRYRIPYEPKMKIIINKGMAISQHDKNSPVAQAIMQLAEQLRENALSDKISELV